jgi:hypothetical protein
MPNYFITGADQKEYGPVTAEQLRQWGAEGRINGQTLVREEGATEWKPLAGYPELAQVLPIAPPSAAPPPLAPSTWSPETLNQDYDLDIGGCVSNSWTLLTNNFGLIFGGTVVFLLVQAGMSLLGMIPFVGMLVSLLSLVVTGPLMGGLYYFFLKNIRRQPAEIGDIFAGFRLSFPQLLLGYLVVALLTGLSALPGLLLMSYPVYQMVQHHEVMPMMLIWACGAGVVAFVPVIYFSTCWIFSLPLIIDKQMDFWTSMGTSRRMVNKHWWAVFGLLVVCALINFAGMLACCIGILVSVPVVLGAIMYAYERIFSPPAQLAA